MPALPRLLAGLATAALLAGCSSLKPDTVDCPELSVRLGSDKVAVLGDDQISLVSVRVWRAAAQCIPGRNGRKMQVGLALVVERQTDQPEDTERIPFDVTFAFLDAGGGVVSRHVHSDDIYMQAFRMRTTPVVTVEMDVPDNTRVVFGLGKAE